MFNRDAMAILGSLLPEYSEIVAKDTAKSKEYYYLVSCKCNPAIVSVESTDSYKARQCSEFMALLEA